MSLPLRPRLRSHLRCPPTDSLRRTFALHDGLRLSPYQFTLTDWQFAWVRLFDGNRTLAEIQTEASRIMGGQPIPMAVIQDLAQKLEEACFLDTPRFRALVDSPERPSCCFHNPDPDSFRAQLDSLFTAPGGPGLPGPTVDNRLHAVLAPHMDYPRGGTVYGHAFKELAEHSTANLFLIIGTSHYSMARFTLTRKHFRTPLGLVPTDERFIDRLVADYGPGLFDDEWQAHYPEHSIELEVVLLQHLFAGRRDIRIVPLVVGSFRDCVEEGADPAAAKADIARMVQALRSAEQAAGEPVCTIISGDLAHIGPKFDDPLPVNDAQLTHSRAMDEKLIARAEAVDVNGYFQVIAAERDERRICGLPPTWTALSAMRPTSAKLLAYDQFVDPKRRESVSFASMAFYR
jgi:AmmeMemoRadiSam system protein B